MKDPINPIGQLTDKKCRVYPLPAWNLALVVRIFHCITLDFICTHYYFNQCVMFSHNYLTTKAIHVVHIVIKMILCNHLPLNHYLQ